MIIAKSQGGVGNQLFQYALGRHLARRNDEPLKLDKRWFEDGKWPFYLDHFETDIRVADASDIRSVVPMGERGLRYGHKLSFNSQLMAGTLFNYYKEHSRRPRSWTTHAIYRWHFTPSILEIDGDAYLEGYWQSEKYFEAIEETLRDELSFSDSLEGEDRRIAEAMDDETAVSLHVRRGDYLQRDMQLPVEYYRRSIDKIREFVDDPQFYLFSDDHEWAKEKLQDVESITFVDHNGPEAAVADLQLMSSCDHHVIANSTFSWWGAWLNDDPEKTVFAPVVWHSNTNVLKNDLDVIPESWEIVEW